MKNITKKIDNPAFTMIELVFVIVALGIIAAIAMPKLDRERRQEAADSILSNIRYAQHMAMSDFRQDFTDTDWQMSFWQFRVEGCSDNGLFMQVGSDKDYGGDISRTESATDPANSLPMFWLNTSACESGGDNTVSDRIFITKNFGVTGVVGGGACAGIQHIGFDHLGRPHVSFTAATSPNYVSYMQSACTFTFAVSGETSFTISIQPESGFAQIVGQNDS